MFVFNDESKIRCVEDWVEFLTRYYIFNLSLSV